MVALVHDHHARGAGQLVQLHAVQTLHGGNGEFGAQALALAGDHGHFPVVQTKAQLGTLLGLLGQIQRVGDPEGWPPQPGDERHADLGLAGPAGGHQHALTPFAGKGGVHGHGGVDAPTVIHPVAALDQRSSLLGSHLFLGIHFHEIHYKPSSPLRT